MDLDLLTFGFASGTLTYQLRGFDKTPLTVDSRTDGPVTYTIGHSHRVAAFSIEIGRRYGLKEEELEQLKYCALLHNIGKIIIPNHILNVKKRSSLWKPQITKLAELPALFLCLMLSLYLLSATLVL